MHLPCELACVKCMCRWYLRGPARRCCKRLQPGGPDIGLKRVLNWVPPYVTLPKQAFFLILDSPSAAPIMLIACMSSCSRCFSLAQPKW